MSANKEGHARTLRSNALQKDIIDVLPTWCLCPVGSIPQHVSTLSAIRTWSKLLKKMKVPCRTARTHESQYRNPWKAFKTQESSPAGGATWMYYILHGMLRSAFSACWTSHCLTWACYTTYNSTTGLNQYCCSSLCPPSFKTQPNSWWYALHPACPSEN